jgi:hypothetical protein
MVDVSLDNERDVAHEISDNFFTDFVEFSRSNVVSNEEPAVVAQLGMGTGLLPDWKDYVGIVVTGGSSSGKSYMLKHVNMASFDYAQDVHGWLYKLSGGSDKAAIDDDDLDDAKVAYFSELQKVPEEMLEFLKSVVEDGGFEYGRNVADSDRESGRKTVHIERDPLSIIFSFADENAYQMDDELRTRLIEAKVDESEEKNKAVHRMKWGETEIRLPSSPHTYITESDDLDHAIKDHIKDIPVDTPVIIPTGEDRFEGDDWSAPQVTEPLFNFKRTDSTRASAQMASLAKSSALYNYHSRPRVDYDGEEHIVVTKQDIGNLIACRETLLALTHGLTEKKFAILDAIIENGAQANRAGTKVQCELSDIEDALKENKAISNMKKSEVRELLREMDEHYLIDVTEHPDDARKNMYVYDGGNAIAEPNIDEYRSDFENVVDPIRDQPITETVRQQQRRFGDKTGADVLDTAQSGSVESDGQQALGNSDRSERHTAVLKALHEAIDGITVPQDVWDNNEIKISHMVGATPLTEEDGYTVPERAPSGADRAGDTLMSPDHEVWGQNYSFEDVDAALKEIIGDLRADGAIEMEATDSGVEVSIEDE